MIAFSIIGVFAVVIAAFLGGLAFAAAVFGGCAVVLLALLGLAVFADAFGRERRRAGETPARSIRP